MDEETDMILRLQARIGGLQARIVELEHKDEYNGWSNYATWATALWLDNDRGSYEWARDEAREAETIGQLASNLRDLHTENMPELGANLWSDLLSAAFRDINWYEIAEGIWNEVSSETRDASNESENEPC